MDGYYHGPAGRNSGIAVGFDLNSGDLDQLGAISVLRIRLQRLGRKNRPFYRVSAVDQKTRRDGRVVEALGWYDPLVADPVKQLELNEERLKYWLSKGAQPTETIRDMLAKRKMVDLESWEKDRAHGRKNVEDKKAKAAAAEAAGEKKEEKKA